MAELVPARSDSAGFTPRNPPGRSGKLRAALFRLAAVLVGLSVFAAAEAVCMLFDWGYPGEYQDPFVGFSSLQPLFVLDESEGRYEIAPSRLKFFAPDFFPARKTSNTFRIFCLGGSTVQGRPFSKETSFTTWLELALNSADRHHNWEVINCGGVSYASYRLLPILRECLKYEPDLFILCTGHNEFLEARTYGHVKRAAKLLSGPHRRLSQFRTFTLMSHALSPLRRRLHGAAPEKPPTLAGEVDALLDYNRGLKAYHRDDAWRAAVVEHFAHSVRGMIAVAANARVPLLVALPPSNLRDTPPFKSQHRDGVTGTELAQWKSLIAQARGHYRDNLIESLRLLREAIKIDGRYAATYYDLGKVYESLGLHEQAREAFLQAREQDVCPLRMLAPMEQALREAAAESDTPLLDAHRLLESQCSKNILGDQFLVDHVHPSIHAHQMIADALVARMSQHGWVSPTADWQKERKREYRRHYESLPDVYFLKGQQTLEAVRAWTKGRADGPPIESRIKPKTPGEKRTKD